MSLVQPYSIDKKLEDLKYCLKNTNLDNISDIKLFQQKIVLPDEFNELQNSLNQLVLVFPEFVQTVGRKQHNTHKYTLDLHMLKAFQECTFDVEFTRLNNIDKRVLLIAAFLHDIEKDEGVVDKLHPVKSAVTVKNILKNIDIDNKEKERIHKIIHNHHWVQDLSKEEKTPEEVGYNIKLMSDFELLKILARADLKAIGNDELYGRLKNCWAIQAAVVEEFLI